MKIIRTKNMPVSNGHYSQCIEYNGLLYLSGQLPIDSGTREIPDSIEEQAKLALSNVEIILKEAGSSLSNVINIRIYIPDIDLWDKVNDIYSQVMGDHKPTRCIIPTRQLHFGCKIEIEATAKCN